MGNSNKPGSNLQVLRLSQPNEWLQLGSLGYCQIVKHSQRGFEAEQYTVQRDLSISEQEELDRYEYRCVQETNFVKVYQVEREQASSTNQAANKYRVRTERIPVRLNQLKDLSFEQGLYIFREALTGYRLVVQLQSPINITEKMIGLTQQGRVKVWINENFAKNSQQSKDKQSITEAAMIDNLYNIIGKHLRNGSFPNAFKQLYEQTKNRNINSVLQLIGVFAANNKIAIPDKLNLRSLGPQQVGFLSNNVSSMLHTPKHTQELHQIHTVNRTQQIASQPILPIYGSHVTEQTLRVPSNFRKEVHTEVNTQRLVVSPKASLVHVNQNNLQVSRTVVTPTPHHTHHDVIHSDRIVYSPRPVVSRAPVKEVFEIISPRSPIVLSTVTEPTTIITHTHATIPRVSSTHAVITSNPPSFEYPHRTHIDLRDAKLLAYAESEFLGFQTKEYDPHVTFIPADSDLKRDIDHVEKRDTVALSDQRAKSEYLSLIMSKPSTPAPNRRQGPRTLYESRRRELRGAPILHQGYDEYMNRLQTGERPKSTMVRTSIGGRGSKVIEKRPAFFAAEKIVTGQTTVERSPKKKYVSADPLILGQSKNEVNKRSLALIKFPIKRHVTVTGYERVSFESDLEPIIKQPQSTREIKTSKSPKSRRDRSPSPEETPWKGMNNSGVFSMKPNLVFNPERPEFRHVERSPKTTKISNSNVKFNLVSIQQVSTQARSQLPLARDVQPSPLPIQLLPVGEHLHVRQSSQEKLVMQHILPARDPFPHIDGHHPKPAPIEREPFQSGDEILKIIEESKKYRMGPSVHLESATHNNFNHNINSSHTNQHISFAHSHSPAVLNFSPKAADIRPNPPSSTLDDMSTLRPETLFEPKPPSKKEPIYQQYTSATSDNYKYSQPISQAFLNSGVSGQLAATESNSQLNNHMLGYNRGGELFQSFGNTQSSAFASHYDTYTYEEEVAYYNNGNEAEVNYYRQQYQQVEYGNSSSHQGSQLSQHDQVKQSTNFPIAVVQLKNTYESQQPNSCHSKVLDSNKFLISTQSSPVYQYPRLTQFEKLKEELLRTLLSNNS